MKRILSVVVIFTISFVFFTTPGSVSARDTGQKNMVSRAKTVAQAKKSSQAKKGFSKKSVPKKAGIKGLSPSDLGLPGSARADALRAARSAYLRGLDETQDAFLAVSKQTRDEYTRGLKQAKKKSERTRVQSMYQKAMNEARAIFQVKKSEIKERYTVERKAALELSPRAPAPVGGTPSAAEEPKKESEQSSAVSPSPVVHTQDQPSTLSQQKDELKAPAMVESAALIVTYTDAGFSPASLTVKAGMTVTFKNESSESMWVASDSHPMHSVYPEFDQGTGAAKGGAYSFTFLKNGTWVYHNHLNASRAAQITVH